MLTGASSPTTATISSITRASQAAAACCAGAMEREELGENVTRWLKSNADLEIVDRVVCQSSDNEFHCYTLVLFYRHKSQPQPAQP